MKKLLVFAAALSFAAAASAQTVPTSTPARPRTEHAHKADKTPEQRAAHAARHLTKQLHLTAAQAEQVQQLQLSRAQQMQQLHAQPVADKKAAHQARKAQQAQYDARLKQILTPDQYAQYAQLQAGKVAKHKAARQTNS